MRITTTHGGTLPLAGPAELDRVRFYMNEAASHAEFAGTPTGEVLDTVLSAEGKLLRPRLLLLCGGFGPEREARLDRLCLLAAMVELTHIASLVHDDIIDDAPFRRGRPSIQSRFGRDAAVYAGDFLITRVNYWAAQERMHETGMLLSAAIERMCAGEIGQARCRYREDVTLEQYLSNIRGKTGSLFSAACALGAAESGCGEETVDLLSRLGERIGIMFQLRDDLLDFTSTEEAEGKETHKDFRDGIYTYPVLAALEQEEGRAALLPLMRKNRETGLDRAELARMEETVVRLGGTDAAWRTVHSIFDKCLSLLDSLEENEANAQIRELLRRINGD